MSYYNELISLLESIKAVIPLPKADICKEFSANRWVSIANKQEFDDIAEIADSVKITWCSGTSFLDKRVIPEEKITSGKVKINFNDGCYTCRDERNVINGSQFLNLISYNG